jgi:hypothetical protein
VVSLASVVLDHPLNNFAPVTPGAFSFKYPMKNSATSVRSIELPMKVLRFLIKTAKAEHREEHRRVP